MPIVRIVPRFDPADEFSTIMRQLLRPLACHLLVLALVAIPLRQAAAQLDVGYDPPPLQGVTTAYVPESPAAHGV